MAKMYRKVTIWASTRQLVIHVLHARLGVQPKEVAVNDLPEQEQASRLNKIRKPSSRPKSYSDQSKSFDGPR